MNPRAGTTDLLVFEARPFSHLGTPPNLPCKDIIPNIFRNANEKSCDRQNNEI